MQNKFLSRIFEGNYDKGSLIGALVLTWLAFIILGALPITIASGVYMLQYPELAEVIMKDPTNYEAYGMPQLLFLGLAFLQFPIGIIGLWFGTKFILKRKFIGLITGDKKFRWGRMFMGMGMWVVLLSAYGLLVWFKDPSALSYTPDWDQFILFLPMALLLVPVQCAFEEIAIRGQLMQQTMASGKFNAFFALISTSVFFSILHSMNPEIETFGWFTMMTQYFTIAMLLGLFSILEEGLELSIGLHTGNNLFSFLLVSYPGSIFDTPAIFKQSYVEPWQDFLGLLAMGFVMFIVFHGRNPQIWQKLKFKLVPPNEKTLE